MKGLKDNNTRGITLIALVITIIVLLILAGVTIAMLTGENGILKQANEAKNKTEEATIEEQKRLAQTEANLNLEEKDYTDKNKEIIKIPAGMAVSYIEGENEINKGLVSIDKNGNEWVWIEVPKSVTQNASTDTEIEVALQTYVADYRKEGYTDTWYEGCGLTEQEYNNNKSKMLQSIKNNSGFWIGRYEVGTDTIRTNASDTLLAPVIRQDQFPYNFVTCSQAQGLTNQLKPNSNDISSLMYGIQWDLVLKWIEAKGEKSGEELKLDSTNWGNYFNSSFDITRGKYSTDYGKNYTDVNEIYTKTVWTRILLTTGASEKNKVLNIYDLAGNEWEWILEKSSNSDITSTIRGSVYNGNGIEYPSSSRYDCNVGYKDHHIGFRSTLYKK